MRLGLVTEAFADRSLADLLDWLEREAPEITDLEIDSGGYAPQAHCDRATLLADPEARRRWRGQIEDHGLRIGALNAWGNPLHPDAAIAMRHDADLCETIRLAAELEVDRIVAMAGCPAAAPGDSVPHFAGGGWLPYLEDVYERQWHEDALPYCYFHYPFFGLKDKSQLWIWLGGSIAFGLIWYYGARAIRRGQGVNVDRVYAEIPPE